MLRKCHGNIVFPGNAVSPTSYYFNSFNSSIKPALYRDITAFMNLPSTRKTLGVPPNITYTPVGWDVNSAFEKSGDIFQPATYHIEALLNHGIRVLIYVGRQDFSCNWVGNLGMTENLDWYGQQGFLDTAASDWTSKNGSSVGWSRTFGDLSFVVVEGAGHMVRLSLTFYLMCIAMVD